MPEKYIMKLTKEDYDEMFNKIYKEGYSSGFKDGYLNGLALSVAHVYEHVADKCVDGDYHMLQNFENAVERMRRKISDDQVNLINNIRKAYEKKEEGK